MSVLTVFGVLSTIGVGLLVRRIPLLSKDVLAGEDAFVTFNVYGLAFSLVASASTVMRRRDTTILILAATVIWGIFVARGLASEMVRFMVFASLITIGLRIGTALTGGSGGSRIGVSTIVGGALCAAGGLAYYGAGGLVGAPQAAIAGGVVVGLLWGFSLGLAVSVGISCGNGVLDWIAHKAR